MNSAGNLLPFYISPYFRITKYENVDFFVSFNMTKTSISNTNILTGSSCIIFRAGNPLRVGQCKFPPESTKPLLVEQSRGNVFTFQSPAASVLLQEGRESKPYPCDSYV